jgi:hypothetical protein
MDDTLEKIFMERKGGRSGRTAGSPAATLLWREVRRVKE